jgi:hypothetical protein
MSRGSLVSEQEAPMPKYTGEVRTNTDDDFPFIAIIVDETGKLVGDIPVRTRADGDAAIVEALKELDDHARAAKSSPAT